MTDVVLASSLQDAIHRTLLLHLSGGGARSLSQVMHALEDAGFDPGAIRDGIDLLVQRGLVEIFISGGQPPVVHLRLSDGADLAAYDLSERARAMPPFHAEPSLQVEAKVGEG